MFFYYSSLLFALLPYVPSLFIHILKWFFCFSTSCLVLCASRLFHAAPRLRSLQSTFHRLSRLPLLRPTPLLFSSLRWMNFRSRPSSLRPAICTLFFLMVLVFFLSAYVQSAQVTLQWDPNLQGNVAGYKVYYGTASGQYQSPIDVGNTTLCTISSLQDGIPYYFAATAYDAAHAESNFSSEIVYGGGGGCTYSLSAGSQSYSSSGGAGTVGLTTSSGCSWTAMSNAAWLIISSNSNGSGTGSVAYSVTSNLTSSSRSGILTIGGKILTVNQAGVACTYSLSPSSQSFTPAGGTGTLTVSAPSGCSWNASSQASWVTIQSGSSGTGNGAKTYSVASNSSSSSRSGTLSIAGNTFTLNQAGVACTYSLSPSSQSFTPAGGTGTLTVSAPSGCSWNASSQASWITIQSGSSGTMNGAKIYTVASNSGNSSRTGTLTVAGTPLTVTQQGISQYNLSINKSGTGSGSVSTIPASTVFNQGTGVTLTATPDNNSSFAGWSGGCTGISPTCALTMNANVSVTAAFNVKTFTIAASAGANGSMSPQGTLSVNNGASQSFTITPAAGYGVSDVKVDGTSIGAATTYLFGKVNAGHTISASFAALPSPAPADFVLAVNAGGGEYIDGSGARYLADQYFSGGTKNLAVANAVIQGTTDPFLYLTERSGKFSYALPVPNGSYDVTLRFVENTYEARGHRVFDVHAEGKVVLSALDIYAASGKNTALDFTFTVSVSDGVLNFHFLPRLGDAQICGILVKKASGPNKNAPGKVKKFFTTQAKSD